MNLYMVDKRDDSLQRVASLRKASDFALLRGDGDLAFNLDAEADEMIERLHRAASDDPVAYRIKES